MRSINVYYYIAFRFHFRIVAGKKPQKERQIKEIMCREMTCWCRMSQIKSQTSKNTNEYFAFSPFIEANIMNFNDAIASVGGYLAFNRLYWLIVADCLCAVYYSLLLFPFVKSIEITCDDKMKWNFVLLISALFLLALWFPHMNQYCEKQKKFPSQCYWDALAHIEYFIIHWCALKREKTTFGTTSLCRFLRLKIENTTQMLATGYL